MPMSVSIPVNFSPDTGTPNPQTATLNFGSYGSINLIGDVIQISSAAYNALCVMDSGWRDYKSLSAETVYVYTKATREAPGGYTYNPSTGEFTANNNGDYIKETKTVYVNADGLTYESALTTTDMFFYRENKADSIVKAFVKIAPTTASMKVSYAGNGNFIFTDEQEYSLGDENYLTEEETGSWDNLTGAYTEVRIDGTKKYHLAYMNVEQPTSESIRFRVEAVQEDDLFEIYAIELEGSGYISEGGDNG
jgi:hypothetical protein